MTYKVPVAWHVHDDDESHTIVFSKHGLAARRMGCEELGLDFDAALCRRAPEFDGCYPHASNLDCWNRGWWFECACGRHARKDDGGMNAANRFFCADCVSGFMEMEAVPMPKGIERFLGRPQRYVRHEKHPEYGYGWSGFEAYDPPADAYPLKPTSFAGKHWSDWHSPYVWFDPWLATR